MQIYQSISDRFSFNRAFSYSLKVILFLFITKTSIAKDSIIQDIENTNIYEDDEIELHLDLAWESRYVTEGRDNLNGNNLLSTATQFKIHNFYFIPWLAHNNTIDFTEVDLTFLYEIPLTGRLTGAIGYTHIYVKIDDASANDDEINIDVSYQLLDQIELSATIYHTFLYKGSFIETVISNDYSLNDKTQLNLQWALGANAGYISDGHTGLNHSQLKISMSYEPASRIDIFSYIGYNLPINRDTVNYEGDESLRNFFWGGIGMVYNF